MAYIKPLTVEAAGGDTAKALAGVKSKLGRVPNIVGTLANSPAALQLYLKSKEALAAGRFSDRTRELIALGVAEANGCGYCLSAHTAIAGSMGMKPGEIEQARRGAAPDARDAAVVALAKSIVSHRGWAPEADLAAAREAGLDDQDIVETIAVVIANMLTNYTNHIARTDIDFPVVEPAKNGV